MNVPPIHPVRMSVFAEPACLPIVRSAVEKLCELANMPADGTGDVAVAVDEAVGNIIRHAYADTPGGTINISLAIRQVCGQPRLVIRLRDFGRGGDPKRFRSRDLSLVRPGGLGMHIMHQCMDSVRYQKARGAGTVLVMTRCLNGVTR